GEFAEVLCGHGSLDHLQESGRQATIIREWLSTIEDLDASPLAEELIISRLVVVLETSPPANVEYQYCLEVSSAVQRVVNQALQARTVLNVQSAPSGIGVGSHDFVAVVLGVLRNCCLLIQNRVLLVFGGHPDVLGSPHEATSFLGGAEALRPERPIGIGLLAL